MDKKLDSIKADMVFLCEDLRNNASFNNYEKAIAASYMAVLLQEYNDNDLIADRSMRELCELIQDESIKWFIYERLKGVQSSIISKYMAYSQETLKDFIAYSMERYMEKGEGAECITPKGICEIVLKILDIQENDEVLDNCIGRGAFVASAYQVQPKANYYGVEINSSTAAIAQICLSIMGDKIHIATGDALDEYFDNKKFDKVFSDHPFGLRIRTALDEVLFDRYLSHCPELGKATSADWIFNYRLCESLKEGGLGVATMPLGGLWNTLDAPIRRAFIKEKRISAIIKLPSKLYETTAIPCALVVFGRGSNHIRFVDASREFEEGRRQNILSDANIQKIIRSLEVDSDISRLVSVDEIVENQFNLNPTRYLDAIESIENGVEFKSVIKNITRGASYSASDLDELSSAMPTDCQYLLLGNVRNGLIDSELPYLKEIPPKFEKYCVHEGNLLLSKNGYPFKVAVVESTRNKKVLANGNLYVIELDQTKVDPYYIKAFLESEQGIAQLKAITVGTTIPNIGINQLNTIQIPLISLEQQRKIAHRCQALLDEIKLHRVKIEKAEDELKSVFSNEKKGG